MPAISRARELVLPQSGRPSQARSAAPGAQRRARAEGPRPFCASLGHEIVLETTHARLSEEHDQDTPGSAAQRGASSVPFAVTADHSRLRGVGHKFRGARARLGRGGSARPRPPRGTRSRVLVARCRADLRARHRARQPLRQRPRHGRAVLEHRQISRSSSSPQQTKRWTATSSWRGSRSSSSASGRGHCALTFPSVGTSSK